MSKYDGKVVIGTAIDNTGMDKGVKNISGSLGGLKNVLKGVGSVITAAFSLTAIFQFGAEASKAARELSDALTGLRSILDGQGKSFSDAQAFIDEYVSDGLIPATNAITAYKNLAMRGYDDSQIRQVMTALKDASAYGRQASYTMGEAVQSATEGLKNENSILVDNAGVTKNVAKMWEEYAASIGTTANNLTQQQKIQAEVTGILEESKYQTGDAAKVADTLSGQLQQLSFNFNNLKVAVGNAINPILELLLPVINTAITVVTRFANSLATLIGLLFGKSTSVSTGANAVADSYSNAAESAEDFTDATKAAGKAAKKSLAGFDELNKLADPATGSGSSSTGGAVTGSSITDNWLSPGGESEEGTNSALEAIAQKIKDLVAPLQEIDFAPLKASLADLGGSFGDLGTTIGESLEWVWFNLLIPLAEWHIEEGGPATLDLLSSAFDALDKALEPVIGGMEEFHESLQPVFEFIEETALLKLENMTEMFDDLASLFEEKGPKIREIIKGIGEIVAITWQAIEPILSKIRRSWNETFETIAKVAVDNLGWLIDALYGVVEFIAGVLTGDWDRAWEGLVGIVKAWVNSIIGFINGMLKAIVGGVNSSIRTINKLSFTVPDWVPVIGGSYFGFGLKEISVPQIPQLAQGAVLPANKPFLAMVGDQKHGTNVEAPLSTIQEAVAVVMQDMIASNMAGHEATVAVLREILEALLGIQIGDEVIATAVDRYRTKMAVMRGG